PDLIIMNATLMDGPATDFIEPLRQRVNRSDLPVIVLTDIQTSSDQLSADFTATDYLVNPFSPPMLRTRVRAWLARAAVNQPEQALRVSSEIEREFVPRGPVTYLEELRSVPVFRSLTDEQLRLLLDCASEQVYASGSTIIRQGEVNHSIYIVLNGRV